MTRSRTIASEWKSTTRRRWKRAPFGKTARISPCPARARDPHAFEGRFPHRRLGLASPDPTPGHLPAECLLVVDAPCLDAPWRTCRPRRGRGKRSLALARWTATSTSRVRPEPRTTNTFSVFILNQKRNRKTVNRTREICQTARTSIVGWPGHYEDILEKRHGEWRILQRKSMINQK
jgi:hypothetical protein